MCVECFFTVALAINLLLPFAASAPRAEEASIHLTAAAAASVAPLYTNQRNGIAAAAAAVAATSSSQYVRSVSSKEEKKERKRMMHRLPDVEQREVHKIARQKSLPALLHSLLFPLSSKSSCKTSAHNSFLLCHAPCSSLVAVRYLFLIRATPPRLQETKYGWNAGYKKERRSENFGTLESGRHKSKASSKNSGWRFFAAIFFPFPLDYNGAHKLPPSSSIHAHFF